MAKAKTLTVFDTQDGERVIREQDVGIHPLVLVLDGAPVVRAQGCCYVPLWWVLDWYYKEREADLSEGKTKAAAKRAKAIETLEKAVLLPPLVEPSGIITCPRCDRTGEIFPHPTESALRVVKWLNPDGRRSHVDWPTIGEIGEPLFGCARCRA